MPELAGTVSAASNCLLMTTGSLSSALAAVLFDGRTAISMAGIMTFCSFLSLICFWTANRHVGRPVVMHPGKRERHTRPDGRVRVIGPSDAARRDLFAA
jgi:hypothetical protein